jgi:hypothetical protein
LSIRNRVAEPDSEPHYYGVTVAATGPDMDPAPKKSMKQNEAFYNFFSFTWTTISVVLNTMKK